MSTLRELKGRIGSVASSEKITGAMKMISSAKMHKAEGILRRLEPYRQCVQSIINTLAGSDSAVSSPLTESRKVERIAIVAMGSDDGLCGAYNTNIIKAAADRIEALRREHGADVDITVHIVGKKLFKASARIADAGVHVENVEGLGTASTPAQIKTLATTLSEKFLARSYDAVELDYMHYYSAGRQRFKSTPYLPAVPEVTPQAQSGAKADTMVIFEPSPEALFSQAVPMYLLATLQEAFAQNAASEQAARVMAMQSANDNAQKLLGQLQLEYNKLRQQSITTELLDIAGGQSRDN